MYFGRICAAVHCCWSLWGQQLLKQTWQCHKPAVRLLSVQQLSSVRDALWQHLCCSVLLLVIVVFCEQHTVTSTLAVTQACCRAVVCTAALISEGCTLAGSVLQCTVAGRCGGSNFSNRHGSATSLLSGCCLYNSSHQ